MEERIIQQKAISAATHAIGMTGNRPRYRPYTRHGKKFYTPWRNRYVTSLDDETWQWLMKQGYADYGYANKALNMGCFWLTRKGLDWLGEQTGITIHDESD